MWPDYYPTLLHARHLLEGKLEGFPDGGCLPAALLVHALTGIDAYQGTYRQWDHAWNYDAKHKLWIDLTLDQFDRRRGEITILPAHSTLLKGMQCTDEYIALQTRANRIDALTQELRRRTR